MERSTLMLIFTAVVVLVLVVYGIYAKLSAPATVPAAMQDDAATRPTLVDRLRDERERRMKERGELSATAPATTVPATAP
jgi:hypothetical protein